LQVQTTILIADDHPLFRGALGQAVGTMMPDTRIVEASGMDEVGSVLATSKDIDLILLDLTMPGVQGFSGLIYLRAQHPEFPVIIV
jgi:DNA-binding NarL/FixJ family response regulator